MGQEQSGQNVQKRNPQLTRAHTIAAHDVASSSRDGGDLMSASLISNSDSRKDRNSPTSEKEDSEFDYTKQEFKPIGSSPKKKFVRGVMKKSSTVSGKEVNAASRKGSNKKTLNTNSWKKKIVVVNEGSRTESQDEVEELKEIQKLPIFQPIIRGTLGLSFKDKESLATLNSEPLIALASKYQDFLRTKSEEIAKEQNTLTKRIKESDAEINRLLSLMVERQRANARTAERLAKVHEMSSQLSRCHSSLNQSLELADTLNGMLPISQRLEPFVWTTG